MAKRDDGDVMTDADFEKALDQLREQEESSEVGELLKMMNENRMISWEEAEQILGGANYNEPVKSSLPAQTRPSEPDNDTDVDTSIQRLLQNDPTLKEINLNNMKRTPVPQLKRLIEAIRDNTSLEKLSLANMGLYDGYLEPLIDVVENNETLRALNLETNYLSGEFFVKLFRAALKNQTLEEVKAVNQGPTFATVAEKEIIESIFENRGLIKVSVNLRLPEGRHKIENAMLRNGEIRRILRRQAAAKAQEEAAKKQTEEAEVKKNNNTITKPTATPKAQLPQKPDKDKAPPKPKISKEEEKPVVEGSSTEKDEKKVVKKAKKTVAKKKAEDSEKKPEGTESKVASTAKDTPAAPGSAPKTADLPPATAKQPMTTSIKKAVATAEKAGEKAAASATNNAEEKPARTATAQKAAPKTAAKPGAGKKPDQPMAVYPRKKL